MSEILVNGCNYHTSWQSHKSMRFVLHSFDKVKGVATLKTRGTRRIFKTKISDLIFIQTGYNRSKAIELSGDRKLFSKQLNSK